MKTNPARLVAALSAVVALVALVPVVAFAEAQTDPRFRAYSLDLNSKAWHFDAAHNVYWQIGLVYAETPATLTYESLGVYVPAAYLKAQANGDGTYTATIDPQGSAAGFQASTAPVVLPVDTGGYRAKAAPTEYKYDEVAPYVQAGFVYVQAGSRGCDNGPNIDGGAPWGVTDLKAAIRYLRFNADVLPGNMGRIVTFGHSGGGAQSSLVGATGDAQDYLPYLNRIGASMTLKDRKTPNSDATFATQAYCPITALDYADSAYEWMLGQYRPTGSRAPGSWTAALSQDLATGFAASINKLGLQDDQGRPLTLTATKDGVFTAGPYYDYLLAQLTLSLNHYLADTFGTDDEKAAAYCAQYTGLSYDKTTHQASIATVGDFARQFKDAAKPVGAFDRFDRNVKKGIAENFLFGTPTSNARHFNAVLAGTLAANAARYKTLGAATYSVTGGRGDITDYSYPTIAIDGLVQDYQEYKTGKDALGFKSLERQALYNPMNYLSPAYPGYKTAKPAAHWRINVGIEQTDTASTVELNLALALQQYGKATGQVKDVALTMVWKQGHVFAERQGTFTDNFIAWVKSLVSVPS
jgi:hypothetical protein